MSAATPPTVTVIQSGSRLHYAIPISLQRLGLLERVYCEWFSRPGSVDRALARAVKVINRDLGTRMLGRYAAELDVSRVYSHPLLTWRMMRRRSRFPNLRAYFTHENQQRARWILRKGFGGAGAVFGFIRSIDPQVCHEARRRGLLTLGDQMIAPAAIEQREDALQRQRFPDWTLPSQLPDYPGAIQEEQAIWPCFDHITCASAYVKEGLLEQGIPSERITVNPYPIDAAHFPFVDRSERARSNASPVTVGFIGAVNLRKGAPYFLQIAKAFDPARVRFVMVGGPTLSPAALDQLRSRVTLAGAVPRSDINHWLGQFDIFLFPSTCEGSAGSIMEAMASGLPVICSPQSGSVIRDGRDGFVIPYDQTDRAISALMKLVDSSEVRLQMGRSAAARAGEFTLDAYGLKVREILAAAR